jgi:uncharacterized membrane protein YdjX (TVP38/TMEM64 family)
MEESPAPWRKAVRPLVVIAVLAALFMGARALRVQLGIEWSAESIQETVREWGYWAPLGFVVIVMFRQFLAFPSMLVLTSAGLLFGAPFGALVGAIGITLNALTLFTSARLFGGDWALPRLHARFPEFEERARTAGPLFIAFMTAHPMGVLTPFHFAAGVTSISFLTFLLAVGPAALFRAACYAYLGAYLLDPGSTQFWIATGVLLVAALLPLAHPGLRARLLARPASSTDEAN